MPPPLAVIRTFAAAWLAVLAAAPAAAQEAGADDVPTGASAAVDRVIDVYTALEAAWQTDRRCRLLATPARRQLDWLEDALDQVVRETFSAETRARLGELGSRAADAPPFSDCGTKARRLVAAVVPEAAGLVAAFAGRRYEGSESYRRFLADSYFQARAALAADVRCQHGGDVIAADPETRDALTRAANALSAVLGAGRVAELDAEAAGAANQAMCGPWLGQALSDAHARLERLHDGLARDAGGTEGQGGGDERRLAP